MSDVEEIQSGRKRRYYILVFIPLLLAVVICASTAGLNWLRQNRLDIQIEPIATADYSAWERTRFVPVQQRLGTAIVRDNGNNAEFPTYVVIGVTDAPDEEPTPTPLSPDEETATSIAATATATVDAPATATASPTLTGTPSSTITATPTITATVTVIPTSSATVTATLSTTATSTLIPTNTPVNAPLAAFQITPVTGVAPHNISVTNQSTGLISSYSWDFGDGIGNATVSNPGGYTYTNPGSYVVRLTVTGPGGSSVATRTVTVSTAPPTDTDVSLSKSASVSGVTTGDTFTYTLVTSNNGAITATNVTITDNLPAQVGFVSSAQCSASGQSVTCNLGNIASGGSASATITVQANSAGTATNTATVSGNEADPNTSNNTASATVTISDPVPTDADLEIIAFSPSTTTPNEGDPVTITLTVRNNGPAAASGVTVSAATGDTGLSLSGYTPGQGSMSGDTWSVGSLASGATATLTIDATVDTGTAGTSITRTRSVSGSKTDPTSGNNSASFTLNVQAIPGADLSLSKTASVASALVGEQFTYTLTVTNSGPAAANNITIVDMLPSQVTYISGPGVCSEAAGTVTCIIPLLGGANGTASVILTVEAVSVGTAVNNATVSADETDPDMSNNLASTTVNITAPTEADLEFTTFTFDNLNPNVGDEITATVEIVNRGPADATNIVLSDNFGTGALGNPTNVTLSHGALSDPPYNGRWTIPALLSGETATMTVTLTVEATAAGTTVSRWREIIASDQPDPDSTPDNGVDTEDDYNSYTVVVNAADVDLQLTKTAPSTAAVGEEFDYTLQVENLSALDATGVTITDTLPPEVSFVSSAACTASGQNVACDLGTVTGTSTATATITVLAESAGTATNNAIVSTTANDTNSANNNASVDVIISGEVDLVMNLTVNPTTALVTIDDITFTFDVTNNGTQTATNVQVTGVLPDDLYFISSPLCTAPDGRSVTCNLGDIAAGIAATTTIVTQAYSEPPSISYTARADAVETDVAPADNEDTATVTVDTLDCDGVNEPNIGPANGEWCSVSTIVLDMGENTAVQTGPGYDLIYYERGADRYPSSRISIDSVIIQVGTSDSGPWTTVMNWGGGTPDTNLSISSYATDGDGEVDNESIPMTSPPLIGTSPLITGIGIDVDAVAPAGVYRYVQVTSSTGSHSFDAMEAVYPGPVAQVDLDITALCSTDPDLFRRWRVRNPNPIPITFEWVYYQSGNPRTPETVNAASGGTPGELVFTTPTTSPGPASLEVWVDGVLQSTTGANNTPCEIDLGISKAVDKTTAAVGEQVTFTVTITNTSSTRNASEVVVTDNIPAGLTVDNVTPSQGTFTAGQWTVGALNASASATLTIVARPQASLAGTTVTNTASITSAKQGDPNTGNNSASAGVAVVTPSADLQVTLSEFNPASIDTGAGSTLEVTIFNSSSIPVTNVIVTNLIPAGVNYVGDTTTQGNYDTGANQWNVGTLSAGGTAQIFVTVNAPSAGSFTSTPTVSSVDITDPNSGNDTGNATLTVIDPGADIVINTGAVTATPGTILVDETSMISVTVTNNGPQTANNVTLGFTLPAGLTILSHGCNTLSVAGIDHTCTLSTPLGSGSIAITFEMRGDASESYPLTFTASADETDPVPGNETGSVTLTVDPTVNILLTFFFASNETPLQGENITYELRVRNLGPDNATGVQITAPAPAGIDYTGGTTTFSTYDPITGVWDLGSLDTSTVAILTINATVTASAGTTVTSQATVTGVDQAESDTSPATNQIEEEITVQPF